MPTDESKKEQDQDLHAVERVLAGDGEIYRILIQRYQTEAMQYAFLMCGNRRQAQKFVGEGFRHAFTTLKDTDRRGYFLPVLLSSLRHVLLQNPPSPSTSPLSEQEAQTLLNRLEQQHSTQDLLPVVSKVLFMLPPVMREMWTLRFVIQLNDGDIQHITNLKDVHQVQTRQIKTLQKIKDVAQRALKQAEDPPETGSSQSAAEHTDQRQQAPSAGQEEKSRDKQEADKGDIKEKMGTAQPDEMPAKSRADKKPHATAEGSQEGEKKKEEQQDVQADTLDEPASDKPTPGQQKQPPTEASGAQKEEDEGDAPIDVASKTGEKTASAEQAETEKASSPGKEQKKPEASPSQPSAQKTSSKKESSEIDDAEQPTPSTDIPDKKPTKTDDKRLQKTRPEDTKNTEDTEETQEKQDDTQQHEKTQSDQHEEGDDDLRPPGLLDE